MSFRRRKVTQGEWDAPPDAGQEQDSTTGESSARVAERIATYVRIENEDAVTERPADVEGEHRAEEEPTAAEPVVAENLATVGEEVDAVLRSAHEAAARIRQAADEEATRVRNEAVGTAASEVAAARRVAEDERAEAARLRAEATAYFQDARAKADAFAEQRRSEAAQEAARIVADAERSREAAAAEAERKLREATANERQRLETLQGEVERHEERLKSILAASRGMTGQLEALLERSRAETGSDAVVSDEVDSSRELETALAPGSSGSSEGFRQTEARD